MAENSKIQWTTHTFNPWRGCTRVSEGCRHCYAETLSGLNPKTLGVWGPNGTRVVAAEAGWREPVKWNKIAALAEQLAAEAHRNPIPGITVLPYERPRVFCASLADVFEDWSGRMMAANGNPMWWCHGSLSNSPVPSAWGVKLQDGCRMITMDDVRVRLLELIADTPHLDWLLLTKRPKHILPTLARPRVRNSCPLADRWHNGDPPANVWLGTTCENQAAADERIPHLLAAPAAVRFLSCEPLLGPVDLEHIRIPLAGESYMTRSALHGTDGLNKGKETPGRDKRVDWVIFAGESGGDARPMQLEWARSLRDQCAAAGVACFVKQMGAIATAPYYDAPLREQVEARGIDWPDPIGWTVRDGQPALDSRIALPLADKKGGNEEEWPVDLRVREFPGARV